MPGILWMASYPKSGNTWLRAVPGTDLKDPCAPRPTAELPQCLVGDGIAAPVEQVAGRPVGDMTAEEIQVLRPKVHEMFAYSNSDTVFVKTHNAISVLDNIPTISPDATSGAVYVVRNPLDVAVSYAHHYGISYDRAIDAMASEDNMLPPHGNQIHQYPGSWRTHVRRWTTAPGAAKSRRQQWLRVHLCPSSPPRGAGCARAVPDSAISRAKRTCAPNMSSCVSSAVVNAAAPTW